MTAVGANIKSAILADIAGFNRADMDRVSYAISCGEKLWMVKADLKHGEWLPFLKEIGLPARTASRWMAIRNLDPLNVKELGSLAKAAELAKLSPAQLEARYVASGREVVRLMGEMVTTYKKGVADLAEDSAMARYACHALAKERGLTDAEIEAEIAAFEAEVEAGMAEIRAKFDSEDGAAVTC